MGAFVYMLKCADNSFYVGSATGEDLTVRIAQHQQGTYRGYTFTRRPVRVVWSEHFERITDAIAVERQIKGWSRAKKEALIKGDWAALEQLSKRRGGQPRPPRCRRQQADLASRLPEPRPNLNPIPGNLRSVGAARSAADILRGPRASARGHLRMTPRELCRGERKCARAPQDDGSECRAGAVTLRRERRAMITSCPRTRPRREPSQVGCCRLAQKLASDLGLTPRSVGAARSGPSFEARARERAGASG